LGAAAGVLDDSELSEDDLDSDPEEDDEEPLDV
jgi:hypothetical protein